VGSVMRAFLAISLVVVVLLAGCGGTSGSEPTLSPSTSEKATAPEASPAQGFVTGTVTDTSDDALEGVRIVAYRQDSDGDRGTAPPAGIWETGPGGDYTVSVEPGTFAITYEADGFATATQTDVVVTEGSDTRLDVQLVPAL
jgi:hypothetical protein